MTAPARRGGSPRKRQSRHRFEILNAFVDFGMKDLTRVEALTWLVLYRDSKRDGTAVASIADIARRVGASPRAVAEALKLLKDRRVVRVVRKGGPSVGPTRYTVNPTMTLDETPKRTDP